jgi:hypothetical protein
MMMKRLKRSQLHQFIMPPFMPPWPSRSRGLFIHPTKLKTLQGYSHFYQGQETLLAAVDAEAYVTDTNWIHPQA